MVLSIKHLSRASMGGESRRGVYSQTPPPYIHIAYGIRPGVAYLKDT